MWTQNKQLFLNDYQYITFIELQILQAALKSHENHDPQIHMAWKRINALLGLKYVIH